MIIKLRDIRFSDLPLLLAWRNHPEVYKGFYEQGYLGKGMLTWEEHYAFWTAKWNRIGKDRQIKIIFCDGRDVGMIGVIRPTENNIPEIDIYIGEVTLHGKGAGKKALLLIIGSLKDKIIRARVLKNNERSIRMFESCDFKRIGEGREGEWLYELRQMV